MTCHSEEEDFVSETHTGSKIDQTQVEIFEAQRRRLMGLSYRMLGSVTDAEDVLQDAWLRWSTIDPAQVDNAEAYLTTVVTRLSLDRLRHLKARREVYSGPWLPEPVAADGEPHASVEFADSLSLALLVVLETLSPLERAAFVLREVFGESYPAVSQILDRTEPAVRQLVRRARQHLHEGGARYQADRTTHTEVVRRFATACRSADLDGLLRVLAPNVVLVSDSGGVAPAPVRPIHGQDKVARLLLGIIAKAPDGMHTTCEVFNGQLGLVARVDGRAITALAVSTSDNNVQTLHLIANPNKLVALDRAEPSALQ
jgi:RNA polymerase sigma-70 factor, ECF subfamily